MSKMGVKSLRMVLCMSFETDQKLRALRSAIDRAQVSLRKAAKLVGVDNTVLTDWYNGKTTPKSDKSIANLDHAISVLERQPKYGRTFDAPEDVKRVGIRLVRVLDKDVLPDERLHEMGSKVIEMMDWGTDSGRYGFTIPDDAMDPDLRLGQLVIVDDKMKVDPNHAVLIETSDGERMVRWATGTPTERSYRANDSQYAPYTASKAKVVGVVVEVRTSLPGDEEQIHRYPKGMRRKK